MPWRIVLDQARGRCDKYACDIQWKCSLEDAWYDGVMVVSVFGRELHVLISTTSDHSLTCSPSLKQILVYDSQVDWFLIGDIQCVQDENRWLIVITAESIVMPRDTHLVKARQGTLARHAICLSEMTRQDMDEIVAYILASSDDPAKKQQEDVMPVDSAPVIDSVPRVDDACSDEHACLASDPTADDTAPTIESPLVAALAPAPDATHEVASFQEFSIAQAPEETQDVQETVDAGIDQASIVSRPVQHPASYVKPPTQPA
jgi:hypothetical protein